MAKRCEGIGAKRIVHRGASTRGEQLGQGGVDRAQGAAGADGKTQAAVEQGIRGEVAHPDAFPSSSRHSRAASTPGGTRASRKLASDG